MKRGEKVAPHPFAGVSGSVSATCPGRLAELDSPELLAETKNARRRSGGRYIETDCLSYLARLRGA